MEKNYYTDDFEQFLKETADDFRMYPSKRVWNSLYNNLHPGRKWPSLTVCLLLVTSIVFIGISHKNEITGSGNLVKKEVTAPIIAYQQRDANFEQPIIPAENLVPAKEKVNLPASQNVLSNAITIPVARVNKQQITKRRGQTGSENTRLTANNNTTENTSLVSNSDLEKTIPVDNTAPVLIAANQSNVSVINEQQSRDELETVDVMLTKNSPLQAAGSDKEKAIKEIELSTIKVQLVPIAINSNAVKDQEWIEDYAFHNQPTASLKSKLLYELYITPSMGYRSFNKNVIYDIPSRPSFNGLNPSQQESPKSVEHNTAFNIAAGYNLLYPKTKALRIKAGIQLNYSGYTVKAHDLGHSTLTTLLLNDPYSGGIELSERSSSLANVPGDNYTKLNNYTLQVSLPFGADVKIAGKHNFQWFVGATIQPTYVLFGNAYLISSDMKNYVYDSKMLRKWNLNTGLETFVSYKTKSGIIFNAGPEFRYQFFSTYDKRYSYNENLHNFGLKLGMIRNF